jgi:hypothetical protein
MGRRDGEAGAGLPERKGIAGRKEAVLKDEIRDALRKKDLGHVARLAGENRKVFSILISLAYDKDDVLCWRAIEAMGKAAGAVVAEDPAGVRTIVQRLLWSMRDEAGGIGWSSPEMLGEIVRSAPGPFRDIPSLILSFQDEEMFLEGILWAVGRMAGAGIVLDRDGAELVIRCLDHDDPQVRGLAVMAASQMKSETGRGRIAAMTADHGQARIYDDHELRETTVGALAAVAVRQLCEGV